MKPLQFSIVLIASLSTMLLAMRLFAAEAASGATDCDRACLTGLMTQFIDALVAQSSGEMAAKESGGAGDKRGAVRGHCGIFKPARRCGK